jgi:predicted AAA+ superfamily ATPase
MGLPFLILRQYTKSGFEKLKLIEKKIGQKPKATLSQSWHTTHYHSKTRDHTGHEFESAIVAELYKQAKTITANVFFYHLRTLDGREVDLLIVTELGYSAFEIKATANVNATDCKHLRNLKDILGNPVLFS